MQKPLPLSIASVPLHNILESEVEALQAKLMAYDGIYEVVVLPEESRIFFKVDRKVLNEETLINYIEQSKN